MFISDPFSDANKGDDTASQVDPIHIRVQQRNGRKLLTTVQGISDAYDKKKLVRYFKKVRFLLLLVNRFGSSKSVGTQRSFRIEYRLSLIFD